MEHQERERARAVFARLLRRHLRRPLRVTGLFLAAMAFGLFCFVFRPFQEVPVEAQSVASGPQQVQGQVESLVVKPVGSPFDAPVAEVRVKAGQHVRKGDVLLVMDTTQLVNDLSLARMELENASQAYNLGRSQMEQELSALKARVSTLKTQAEQERAMMQSPQQYVDATGTAYVVTYDTNVPLHSEAQVAQEQALLKQRAQEWTAMMAESRASVEAARKEVKRVEGLIAAAERRSPIDGVVSEVTAAPGQWATAYVPMVKVDDPAGFRVVTLVDGTDRARVREEAPVPVQLPDGQGEARLDKVEAGWDKEVGYYWVWLKPERTDSLLPGQPVAVTLPAPASPPVMLTH